MGALTDYAGALAAGALSFLSPCVLPLVPSYLALLAGASTAELRDSTDTGGNGARALRTTLLVRSLAFVLGFALLFVSFGILFSSAAAMIGDHGLLWRRISGLAVVVLGLNILFGFASILNRENRKHSGMKPRGIPSAMLFGAAFGAGWSPCVGPMLASMLFLAGSGSLLRAGSLLFAYSLGLGLPFIGMAYFFGRLDGLFAWLRRRMGTIKTISGLLLIAMGLGMAAGNLQSLSADAVRLGYALADAAASAPVAARIAASILWFLSAAGISALLILRLHKKNARRPALPAILLAFSLLAFISEAAGWISTARLVSSWLLFQGF